MKQNIFMILPLILGVMTQVTHADPRYMVTIKNNTESTRFLVRNSGDNCDNGTVSPNFDYKFINPYSQLVGYMEINDDSSDCTTVENSTFAHLTIYDANSPGSATQVGGIAMKGTDSNHLDYQIDSTAPNYYILINSDNFGNGTFSIFDNKPAFISVGSGGDVFSSTVDGLMWKSATTIESNPLLNDIAVGPNGYVLVWSDNMLNSNFLWSQDGIKWESHYITKTVAHNIYFLNGKYLAFDENGMTLISSQDGKSWNESQVTINDQTKIFGAPNINRHFRKIAYSSGFSIFLALLDDDFGSQSYATSVNGYNWDIIPKLNLGNNISNINSANHLFFLVGESGIIETINDFKDPKISTVGNENLHDITYGNGLYIVVGDNGSIFVANESTTPNFNWTRVSSGTNYNLTHVSYAYTYNHTLFEFSAIGVSQDGTSSIILYSHDGAVEI